MVQFIVHIELYSKIDKNVLHFVGLSTLYFWIGVAILNYLKEGKNNVL